MAAIHETWQEFITRMEKYREELPILFPEIFKGQDEYTLELNDKHYDENIHKFVMKKGAGLYDIPCFRYSINLDKNSFMFVYNYSHRVEAASYRELIEKRNAVLAGEITFVRLPEFQCKFYLWSMGIDFWSNGADNFGSVAHSATNKNVKDCVQFAVHYFTEAYNNYICPNRYKRGYIEHERRVEENQLAKELISLKKRKNEHIKKEHEHPHDFEIFIEETCDDVFLFAYKWQGIQNKVYVPTNAPEGIITNSFESIFSEYFAYPHAE